MLLCRGQRRTVQQIVDPVPSVPFGADRRHSNSWSWRANRWSSRFSPRTEFYFNAFLLQYAFPIGLWSRSSTFLFPVEAFTIFAQVRVHPLLRTFQLVFKKALMSLFKGFFALFPKIKKVRRPQPSESQGARQCQLMDSGGLCGPGLCGRAGATAGR